ncbi:hypothetical protein BC833DRAFT_592295 [Globomyces pollinis-pini]|nr:hypothetical protein BC833DRAFT_592295 [Globomyces pollinis-pini]
MSTSPPREIIKWLQSLNLTFPIKNYKRDFANGFLVAEILSKYYPLDIQMHSFDTGASTSAKKNNWGMLERIFVKNNIPITRELSASVSNSNPKSVSILLSLIFAHVNNKSPPPDGILATSINLAPTNGKNNTPTKEKKDQPQVRTSSSLIRDWKPSGTDPVNTITTEDSVSVDPLNINQITPTPKASVLTEYDKEESTSVGKLICTKILCGIFGLYEPHATFYRNMYQPSIAREFIISNIDRKQSQYKDDKEVERNLKAIGIEISSYVNVVNSSYDFQMIFDTCLPILVHHPPTSQVFQTICKTICYFGEICRSHLPVGDAYKRLSASREFLNIVKSIGIKYLNKIPYFACLLHAYVGNHIQDSDRIKIFLDLKTVITSGSISQSGSQNSYSGAEYIFFLAAYNSIEGTNLHSVSSQLTVFHLSECLNIINSYKSSNQRRSLLVYKEDLPTKNSITSQDIPSLEVSGTLHILASILDCKVSLKLRVLADVVGSALRIFFKIVLHPNCPSHLKKAYLRVVFALMNPELASQLELMSSGISNELIGVINIFLKKYSDEVLRDTLLLMSPFLSHYPHLSFAFVTALIHLDENRLSQLLITDKPQIVSWGLAFLFDKEVPNVCDVWFSYGLLMGIVKWVESCKGHMSCNTLLVLRTILEKERDKPEYTEEDFEDEESLKELKATKKIPKNAINYIYTILADNIINSFAVHDTCHIAWDVWVSFIALCDTKLVLAKFQTLLAVLIYVNTLEKSRCRRRLLSRLRRFISYNSKKETANNEKDTSILLPFDNMSLENIELLQSEANRVLRIFRRDLPSFSWIK